MGFHETKILVEFIGSATTEDGPTLGTVEEWGVGVGVNGWW